MSDLTWHLKRSIDSLFEWYYQMDLYLIYSKTSNASETRIKYKNLALKAKTLGLVYHDRYKMILDCSRNLQNLQ